MKILILEDELKIRKQLIENFKIIFENAQIDAFKFYADAKDQVDHHVYDIISLDIHVPDGNGLELAKYIREGTLNKHAYLLMITGENTLEVAFTAYDQTKCFKFLPKPFNRDQLLELLKDLKSLIEKKPVNDYFIYKNRQMILKLASQEIISFEVHQRSCYIKTLSDQYVLQRLTIKELLKLISKDFLQCHRSTIINCRHIKSLSVENRIWQVQMANGSILPIGKKFLDNLKEHI